MKEKELSSQSSNVWNEISERKYMNRKLEHELDAYEIDDLMDKFDIKNGCTNYGLYEDLSINKCDGIEDWWRIEKEYN